MAVSTRSGGYIERPKPSGLADVLEILLDKGLVIDIYLRVSLVGIELLTVDARIVVASVDTYLRFAEAVGRLNIAEDDQSEGLPQLIQDMTSGGAKSKTQGAIEGVKEKLFGSDDDDDDGDDDDSGSSRRSRATARSSSSRSRSSRSSSGSGSGSSRSGSGSSGSRSRSRSGSGSSS
jgi:gas vesicle structural protein